MKYYPIIATTRHRIIQLTCKQAASGLHLVVGALQTIHKLLDDVIQRADVSAVDGDQSVQLCRVLTHVSLAAEQETLPTQPQQPYGEAE